MNTLQNEIKNLPHNIILEDRNKLVLSGVVEVCSFEEDNVSLKTTKGDLTVRGDSMKMEDYRSETGDMTVKGNVYAIVYMNDSNSSGGFFRRIFK